MSKLTIKHYRNTLYENPNSGRAPIYVRVTYKRKSNNFLSYYVNFPINEDTFEHDRDALKRIEYETSMIKFIMDSAKSNNIEDISLKNIKDLICSLSQSVDYLFELYYLSSQHKYIISTIIDRTYKYSGLSKEEFSYLFIGRNNEFTFNFYSEFISSDDITDIVKDRIKFYLLLYEFGKTIKDRENLEELICYNVMSWFCYGCRDAFLDFANSKKVFDKSTIEELTKDFDETLNTLVSLSCEQIKNVDVMQDEKRRKKGKTGVISAIPVDFILKLYK